jgi:hypothetical protein
MSILSAGTTNSTALNLTADTSGSLILASNNGTTAITVDTSQNVGIGTVSPATKFHVSNTATNTVKTRTEASTGYVEVGMGGNSGVFDTTGSDGIRLRMSSSDKVSIDGSTLALSGLQGIKFQASQSASSDANTLDDYEEGTWTPTDYSGAGLSLTINGATYVKIGQLVVAYCQINYPSTSNGNGAAIAGLPFTVAGQDIYGGFTRYSTYGYVHPTLAQSGTYGSLYTTTGAQITNASLSSKRVDFTYVYRSNA